MIKTLFRSDDEENKHIVYTDDPEKFSKEVGFTKIEMTNFSWMKLMDIVQDGERKGYSFVIDIRELYYETLGE